MVLAFQRVVAETKAVVGRVERRPIAEANGLLPRLDELQDRRLELLIDAPLGASLWRSNLGDGKCRRERHRRGGDQ